MQLIYNKDVIHIKDAKGNGLLHIAAKNRNTDQFKFLLKKIGIQGLAVKNNVLSLFYVLVKENSLRYC